MRVRAVIAGTRRRLERIDGAGDVAEIIIRTGSLGLARPCESCEQRKQALNRLLPNPLRRKEGTDANPEEG